MTGLAALLKNRRYVFAERYLSRTVRFAAIIRRLRDEQHHQ
jgi:hypothetical protein